MLMMWHRSVEDCIDCIDKTIKCVYVHFIPNSNSCAASGASSVSAAFGVAAKQLQTAVKGSVAKMKDTKLLVKQDKKKVMLVKNNPRHHQQ